MEDIFDLSVSEKEQEFISYGLDMELDVSVDILDTLYNIPYIGSIIKLGKIGTKYQELHFIRKLARFLEKEKDIPLSEKEKFLNGINSKQRKVIFEYLTHYLLRSEDDLKADVMGYIYKERVYGFLDDHMFLRLCSIVDKSFIYDLKALPLFVKRNAENPLYANNLINLGLIDNYVGGLWKNEPDFELNCVGKMLYDILENNNWFLENKTN